MRAHGATDAFCKGDRDLRQKEEVNLTVFFFSSRQVARSSGSDEVGRGLQDNSEVLDSPSLVF